MVASPCFEKSISFNENVEVIKSKRAKVELKKPIFCEFAILEFSKLMYDFHYNVIKKPYGERAKLLFSDTEIETEDIYDDLYNNKVLYDLSDYSDDHDYYKNNNLNIDLTQKNYWKVQR